MKYILFLSLIVSTIMLAGCSTPTKIVNSWKDPNTAAINPPLHKIVVAALIKDPGVRRETEDYMASLYPGLAAPSYTIFGNGPLNGKEDDYNQKLKDDGYDGIIILHQTNANVSQHYVPGQLPTYYSTWGGYWHNGWATTVFNPGTPGHTETDRNWIVQVNVYGVNENKLLWSANTSTTNPGGRLPLFKDVCNAVHSKMKKDGLLVVAK